MRRRVGLATALGLVAAWGGGCQPPAPLAVTPFPTAALVTATPDEPEPATPVIATAAPDEGTPAEATPPLTLPSSPDPIEAAIEALSRETGRPPDGIELLEAIPVQWNDSSLGCPQPGQAYLQVVTPGYLVTLMLEETIYQVHADLAGRAIVCFNTGDPIGPGTVPDPIVAEFIMQARMNLARELGVSPEAIALVRSEAVEWSDSSLGCLQEDGEVVQAVTPGYRIVLAVDEERYEYHTDQQRMMLCAEPTE